MRRGNVVFFLCSTSADLPAFEKKALDRRKMPLLSRSTTVKATLSEPIWVNCVATEVVFCFASRHCCLSQRHSRWNMVAAGYFPLRSTQLRIQTLTSPVFLKNVNLNVTCEILQMDYVSLVREASLAKRPDSSFGELHKGSFSEDKQMEEDKIEVKVLGKKWKREKHTEESKVSIEEREREEENNHSSA